MKVLEKFKIDLIVDSRERYKEAVLSLLEAHEINNKIVMLDLGAGNGLLTSRMAKRLGCLNIFTHGYEEVKKVYQPYFQSTQGDLNEPLTVFRADVFDVVIASQLIEHLHNTDGFLKEILRVLKPTGYAIISTPNLAAWHNALYLFLGKQPEVATVSDEMYPWKEKPGHRRVFTATELVKLLEFHGFKIEKIVGSSYFPFMGRTGKLLSRIDWRHAGNITVEVRRCPI